MRSCALTDDVIKKGQVYMRLVTAEEIKQIDDALFADQATFEYRSGKTVNSLLKQGASEILKEKINSVLS